MKAGLPHVRRLPYSSEIATRDSQTYRVCIHPFVVKRVLMAGTQSLSVMSELGASARPTDSGAPPSCLSAQKAAILGLNFPIMRAAREVRGSASRRNGAERSLLVRLGLRHAVPRAHRPSAVCIWMRLLVMAAI